jgi:hypothetical protein
MWCSVSDCIVLAVRGLRYSREPAYTDDVALEIASYVHRHLRYS